MFTIGRACAGRADRPDDACSGQAQTARHGEPTMYRIITGLQACTATETASDRTAARTPCCGSCDRVRIEAHLLSLNADDRSLRFSAGVVTDDSIRAYVARIRFGHDMVLGLVSQRGLLFGLAHGCVYDSRGQLHVEAAFSVDAAWRGFGLGTALMDAVKQQAQNIATDRTALVGLCSARNRPMRRIFESAGLAMQREGDEVHAHAWVNAPSSAEPGQRATH